MYFQYLTVNHIININILTSQYVRKHPEPQPSDESVMIDGEIPFIGPAVFANIDETTIAKAALNTRGAAGPSVLNAQGWRHIFWYPATMALLQKISDHPWLQWQESWQLRN